MEIVKHFRYKDGKEYVFFEGKGYEVKRELEYSERIELLDWYQTARIDYFIERLKEYAPILSDKELDKLFDTIYKSPREESKGKPTINIDMDGVTITQVHHVDGDKMRTARLRGEL